MEDICTNHTEGEGAAKLYNNLFKKRFKIKECPYPCNFLKTTFGNRVAQKDLSFYLKFNRFIKTTKSYYAYGELELLAEFGGYVGLFLGYSVLSLTDAFDKVLHLMFSKFPATILHTPNSNIERTH